MNRKILTATLASLVAGGFVLSTPALAAGERDRTAGEKVDQAGSTASAKVDDASLVARIKSNMLRSSEVEGLDVNVDVKDGVVTLSGTADTQAEKASAEKIAKAADGVKRVDNRIVIKSDNAADDRPALPPPVAPAPGAPPVTRPPVTTPQPGN